ncbi:hypothetical protein H0H93_007872, partial [Arthromyces matolae]
MTCYPSDYYQCLPPSSSATTVASTATTSKSTTSTTSTTKSSSTGTTTSTAPPAGTTTNSAGCSGSLTKFKFFGVNQSGAEFGSGNIPTVCMFKRVQAIFYQGVLGTDYTWPSPSSIDYFVADGFNTFRVTFLMERLSPPANGLTGAFDSTYLSGLTTASAPTQIVNYITNKGAYAVIDPHNYMRYNGNIITSSSDFSTWWTNLAAQFNEPYGIDATTVYSMMQAAVNAIRASGATSQLILVEGTAWTGAWSWISSGNAAAFAGLTDPSNNIAIEMHQYLDSDDSGTSDQCVNATIGANRIADATNWLKANNFKGFLGEIGAGSNSVCISAVQSALCAMQQSGGVWI